VTTEEGGLYPGMAQPGQRLPIALISTDQAIAVEDFRYLQDWNASAFRGVKDSTMRNIMVGDVDNPGNIAGNSTPAQPRYLTTCFFVPVIENGRLVREEDGSPSIAVDGSGNKMIGPLLLEWDADAIPVEGGSIGAFVGASNLDLSQIIRDDPRPGRAGKKVLRSDAWMADPAPVDPEGSADAEHDNTGQIYTAAVEISGELRHISRRALWE